MADNDDYMVAKANNDSVTELMWDRLQEGINANRRYRLKVVTGGGNWTYSGGTLTWTEAIVIYFTRESDGAWVYNTISPGNKTSLANTHILYVILNDTSATSLTVLSAAYGSMPTDDTGRILILGGIFNTVWGTTHFRILDDVKVTGNQTVAGIKTFSSIPVLPASDPTVDDQAARKKYVDDLIALVSSRLILFDMSWFTFVANDRPSFISYDQTIGTTQEDSNTYVKMTNATDLTFKMTSGSGNRLKTGRNIRIGASWTGGVRMSMSMRYITYTTASSVFYFAPIWITQNATSGAMVKSDVACKFGTSGILYYYSGSAYVTTNFTLTTSYKLLEWEMMPNAREGDIYVLRMRWREDGGTWTEGYVRTDLFTQADDVFYQFIGVRAYAAVDTSAYEIDIKDIKVEMLEKNWEY